MSLLLACFMLYTGIRQILNNFKILMDLLLPEVEQLMIMRVLANEFESYENVGNIYSRRSGRQRFIDIELLYINNIKTVF